MYRLPRWISYPAAMTLSAQIASLPIIIWYFNQVSLSSILSNIFVMPFLEFVIVGGLLGGIIALVIPFIGKIIFIGEALISIQRRTSADLRFFRRIFLLLDDNFSSRRNFNTAGNRADF